MQVERDEGDGLAQAHVVGEAGPEAERGHPGQPAQAAQLVVAQAGPEPGRGSDPLVFPRVAGEPCAQAFHRAGGLHGDPLAVDLRGSGEYGGQRVRGGDRTVLERAGPAGLGGVDQHPLVAQPHQGAVRLGEAVQLGGGEVAPVAEGVAPAEGEQGAGREQTGGKGAPGGVLRVRGAGTCRGRGADDGARGQPADEPARPVHLHPVGGERGGGFAEQLRDLLVGELDGVRDGSAQQRGEWWPQPGGPAQGPQGVQPGAGREGGSGGSGTGPDVGGVGDQRGIGRAVHLEDGAKAPGVPGGFGGGGGPVRLGRGASPGGPGGLGCPAGFPGELDPEGEARAGIVTGGHLRGPLAQVGASLGRARREGGPTGGRGRRGGARQGVGDRVEEGAQQRLRGGQPGRPLRIERPLRIDRYATGGGRHGGGQGAHFVEVDRFQWPDPPGVVAGGADARQ